MFAFFGWMICAVAGLLLSISCLALRRKFLPLLAFILSWVSGALVFFWDSIWYMD